MLENSFKVALYIRVSTDRQAREGDSLEEQESELRKFCEYKGYLIHKVFVERGRSGGTTNRPEYQTLIKVVKAKKIQAVVVKKLDRLSRSLMDFETFILLLQEKNIEFISLKESFDTTTAMGKAMLRVALVFAQLEREQTAERISDVMDYRAAKGLYNGSIAPFGYTNVDKQLVPYEHELLTVNLIFDRFLEIKSTTEVAKLLNETGVKYRQKPWSNTFIQKILQNPVYKGYRRWKGKEFKGVHQPIISETKFGVVQEIFHKRKFLGSKNKSGAILQKLLVCGDCKSPMTPSYAVNRSKSRYYYYRCTSTNRSEQGRIKCKFKYVPFIHIEPQLIDILNSLSKEDFFHSIDAKIQAHNAKVQFTIKNQKTTVEVLQDQLNIVRKKKDDYLDSLISSRFLSSERSKINKRIEALEKEESQSKANIYKLELDISQKADEFINLTDLKKDLLKFRTVSESYDPTQLKDHLTQSIKVITYHPEKLSVQFHLLPWPVDFPITAQVESRNMPISEQNMIDTKKKGSD